MGASATEAPPLSMLRRSKAARRPATIYVVVDCSSAAHAANNGFGSIATTAADAAAVSESDISIATTNAAPCTTGSTVPSPANAAGPSSGSVVKAAADAAARGCGRIAPTAADAAGLSIGSAVIAAANTAVFPAGNVVSAAADGRICIVDRVQRTNYQATVARIGVAVPNNQIVVTGVLICFPDRWKNAVPGGDIPTASIRANLSRIRVRFVVTDDEVAATEAGRGCILRFARTIRYLNIHPGTHRRRAVQPKFAVQRQY